MTLSDVLWKLDEFIDEEEQADVEYEEFKRKLHADGLDRYIPLVEEVQEDERKHRGMFIEMGEEIVRFEAMEREREAYEEQRRTLTMEAPRYPAHSEVYWTRRRARL